MACKGGTLKSGTDNYYPNAYYKVGDLFLTTRNENPSLRFGGTWELFGKGKTLVCVDTGDSDFSTVKKTGGEKKHTLTINEMPKHAHEMRVVKDNETNSGGSLPKANNSQGNNNGWSDYVYDITNYAINNKGGGQSHNNLQPYITCYIWIRTE